MISIATKWAAGQEQIALEQGTPLNAAEMSWAKAVGVWHPEYVRLMFVKPIPVPDDAGLRAAMDGLDSLPAEPRGLTLRYGIFLHNDFKGDRHLLLHELVHTAQYEQLGGIAGFLKQYLPECFTLGYRSAPLEVEADRIANKVLHRANVSDARPFPLSPSGDQRALS